MRIVFLFLAWPCYCKVSVVSSTALPEKSVEFNNRGVKLGWRELCDTTCLDRSPQLWRGSSGGCLFGGGGTAGLFEKSAGLIGTHVRVSWHVYRLSSIFLWNLAVVSSFLRVFKPIILTRNRMSFITIAILVPSNLRTAKCPLILTLQKYFSLLFKLLKIVILIFRKVWLIFKNVLLFLRQSLKIPFVWSVRTIPIVKLTLNNVLMSYFGNGLACLHNVSEAGLKCNRFSSVADDHFVFFLIMCRNALVYDYTIAIPFCSFNKENMVSYFGLNPLST